MPWKNGYYYRNRRIGQHVVTEYVGAGPMASLVAEQDQAEREALKADREAMQAERLRYLERDKAINDTLAMMDNLTKSVLELSGYYQHSRTWRRKGGGIQRSNS